jgi:integrase
MVSVREALGSVESSDVPLHHANLLANLLVVALIIRVIAVPHRIRANQAKVRLEIAKHGSEVVELNTRAGRGREARRSSRVRWTSSTSDKLSMRIHDLRHTCATLLLAQDVHSKVVREILGHLQISLTMDTYSTVLQTVSRAPAEHMDAVLRA